MAIHSCNHQSTPATPHFIRYPETLLLDRLFDQINVAYSRQQCTQVPKIPKIAVHGTIKLHGTHTDVVFTRRDPSSNAADTKTNNEDLTWIQSRNRIIVPDCDNQGSAAFLQPRLSVLREAAFTAFPTARELILAGEYAGPDVFDTVALAQLPNFFAVFNVKVDSEWVSQDALKRLVLPDVDTNHLYNIMDFKLYDDVLDFADLDATRARLMTHTLAVEEECPFARQAGGIRNGTGEGIVWTGSYDIHGITHHIRFKTKGYKHREKGYVHHFRVPKNTIMTPTKVEAARIFVENSLAGGRLEQGLEWLEEMGLEKSRKSTGQYMQWVTQDVKKEEQWRLGKVGLLWKDVGILVSTAAREFYFEMVEKG